MSAVILRIAAPVPAPLLDQLHALNERHAIELSSVSRAGFDALVAASFAADCVGDGEGFLISFDETSAYDSPNFLWFRARYPRFVYIDRVVIGETLRGQGFAKALYTRLFAEARAAGRDIVVCEVNFDPPNPQSEAFHDGLGFAEVGRAVSKGKGVRYLAKDLLISV